jgi:YfiH family protein
VITSALLSGIPGIIHGFGEMSEPLPSVLAPGWDERKPGWKQVHGAAVAEVRGAGQACGEVDGLWTRATSSTVGAPIAVAHADCVPVLLAREDGGVIAAVHAGWRGTRARILGALWRALGAEGEDPALYVAAVGPAIGPCCYQVSEEIAADFAHEFSALSGAVPAPRMLDLATINQFQLHELGIKRTEILRYCTRCSKKPEFHSYRREGGNTRQWSGLMINRK